MPQKENSKPFIELAENFNSLAPEIAYAGLGLEDFFDLLEDMSQMDFESETNTHPDSRISIAQSFFGIPLNNPQEIYQNAQNIMTDTGYDGEVPDMTSTTGFDRLKQMIMGKSNEDYLYIQQVVVRELVNEVLESQEVNHSDVGFVLAATSIPVTPRFDKEWMSSAGIDQETPSERFFMACNSSGRALAELLSGQFDQQIIKWREKNGKSPDEPTFILLIALDDPNRLSDKGGDPLSPQYFSTGAAVVGLWYHPENKSLNSLQYIQDTHVSKSIGRGTQYLKVVKSYKDWSEEEMKGAYLAKHLQEPDSGAVEMSPRAGVVFKNYGLQTAKESLQKYIDQGGSISDISRVIVHHPSLSVFESLKEAMVESGFANEQIHWVISEGNIPVATVPIALGRQLKDLQSGDTIMVLSFGAGGEYTCFFANLGSLN